MPNHKKGGRPRLPDAVKELQGTARKDRTSRKPPGFRGNAKCPSDLSAGARAEWERLAPQLGRLKMLTAADQAMFAAYCQAYDDFMRLTKWLNQRGPTRWSYTTDKGNILPIPQVAQRKAAWQQLREAATHFGFSPSSRSGINLGAPNEDDGLALAEAEDAFLAGGKAGPALVK